MASSARNSTDYDWPANHQPQARNDPESMHLPICTACGTQFDEPRPNDACRICDDPRQFVPPTGQSWTTLQQLRDSGKYTNKTSPFSSDPRFISIWTEPKFAIGQRCVLIKTPQGNVLWDCITYLDSSTINFIKEQGGLKAIVISHPHYYSTHLEWASAFDCPVYFSSLDAEWLCRHDSSFKVLLSDESLPQVQFEQEERDIGETGVKALKLGGHFPGSLVCLYGGRLLVADTLVTTPAGLGDWAKSGGRERPRGMNSFAFMWSIPNMIPLSPDELAGMWSVLKKHDFRSTHGAFVNTDIEHPDVKKRVLESMQIQCRYNGHPGHALLSEREDLKTM